MKTCAAALSILSGLAMAAPAVRARDGVCQSFIYSSPQCCSTANGGFLSCQTCWLREPSATRRVRVSLRLTGRRSYIGRGYPEFQEELRRKGPSPVLHHLCAEPEVLLRRAWQRVGRGRLVRVGLCVGHVDSGRDGLDRYCSVLDGRTRGLGSVAFVRSKHAFHVVCGLKSWVRPVESLSAVDGGQDC